MCRSERLTEFAKAIAEARWEACPALLYRVIYGLPSSVLMPMTAEHIARVLPVFETRWPNVTWPRKIVEHTMHWIARFGRSIPDAPERKSVEEARFVFSLDALLLAACYPENRSVLTSSCACAIREIVAVDVELSAAEDACRREWQRVLDELLARKVLTYDDCQSTEQLEADLQTWEDHEELLIVPDGLISISPAA